MPTKCDSRTLVICVTVLTICDSRTLVICDYRIELNTANLKGLNF